MWKQHGSIVGLGAPQEREWGGMGPRDTSPVWLRGLPQPGQAGTATTDGLGGLETSVSPWPPQERISQWHDQSSRYSTELRDFKNQVLGMLEAAEKEREAMRAEAESAAVRVDRLEREVDYLETQNPAPPCVEVDETLMDKQVATAKQRKNEKYTKLTGEGLPWLPEGWSCVKVTPTLPSPPQSKCPPKHRLWHCVPAGHLRCLWHKLLHPPEPGSFVQAPGGSPVCLQSLWGRAGVRVAPLPVAWVH